MSRRRIVVAVALAAGVLLLAEGGLGGHDLLCLAPALVLVGTLLARRYPGERLLLALAAREHDRRLRPVGRSVPALARTADIPRGGLLMAFALAVRPPPCSRVAS